MVIKHIVLSGGAYLGFYQFGAMQYLAKHHFYHHKDIQSIYGTSVGGLIGAIMCLHSDWSIINDYFVDRPWQKLAHVSPSMVFDAIPNKGLLNKSFIDEIMTPLVKSAGFQENITMKNLYEFSNIHLCLYTIDINTFELIELSHDTTPELELLSAIYMSCCLPYVFQPFWHNETYYIDGGLLNSYPIGNCIDRNCKVEEILSCTFQTTPCIEKIVQSSSIFEFGYFLYRKLVKKARQKEIPKLQNEIVIPCVEVNMSDASQILYANEIRQEYIDKGAEYARLFLEEKENK